jgi:hypothetical protein
MNKFLRLAEPVCLYLSLIIPIFGALKSRTPYELYFAFFVGFCLSLTIVAYHLSRFYKRKAGKAARELNISMEELNRSAEHMLMDIEPLINDNSATPASGNPNIFQVQHGSQVWVLTKKGRVLISNQEKRLTIPKPIDFVTYKNQKK